MQNHNNAENADDLTSAKLHSVYHSHVVGIRIQDPGLTKNKLICLALLPFLRWCAFNFHTNKDAFQLRDKKFRWELCWY